jgi:hypothetical protein
MTSINVDIKAPVPNVSHGIFGPFVGLEVISRAGELFAASGVALGSRMNIIITASHVLNLDARVRDITLIFTNRDGGSTRVPARAWAHPIDPMAPDLGVIVCEKGAAIEPELELAKPPDAVFQATLFGFLSNVVQRPITAVRRGTLLEYIRGEGEPRFSGGAVVHAESNSVIGIHSGWVSMGDGLWSSSATVPDSRLINECLTEIEHGLEGVE